MVDEFHVVRYTPVVLHSDGALKEGLRPGVALNDTRVSSITVLRCVRPREGPSKDVRNETKLSE